MPDDRPNDAPQPSKASAERLRVLIVAEHASAAFGGEAALPLHYFRTLRGRGEEVWLLTHARVRGELSQRFPTDTGRIVYIEDTGFHRLMWRVGQRMPARIANITVGFLSRLATQWTQRSQARRLVRELAIDVVHQPMPVSPKEPSLLYDLGAPVVIGPMNGGMDYPPSFRTLQRPWVHKLIDLGRQLSHLMNRCMPGKLRAAALLVANERTRLALPRGVQGRVLPLVENGVDLTLWRPPVQRPAADDRPTRFAYMGRLVDWKAVDLLIQAFGEASVRAPMSLRIIGGGPQMEALKAQAARAGLLTEGDDHSPGKIRFDGWLAQGEAAERLASQDCLVLPSLMECGGAVVLEAMSMQLPVIATAWGGPLDYLDETTGVLVPPDTRGTFVAGLAQAMERLAGDPEVRRRMGLAAREKVLREFDWEGKTDRMLGIYRQAIADGRGS